jgi:hypothetical protein
MGEPSLLARASGEVEPRAALLRFTATALLACAVAAALLDAASTYVVVASGRGQEGNPAVAALVNGQPLWVFPCAVLLLVPLPFLPELPRLIVSAGFVAGHGVCALSNLALLRTGSAPLSGWMPVWTLVVAPALSGVSLLAILKLGAPRRGAGPRAIVWLVCYALYIVGLEAVFWMAGRLLTEHG